MNVPINSGVEQINRLALKCVSADDYQAVIDSFLSDGKYTTSRLIVLILFTKKNVRTSDSPGEQISYC